MPRRTCRGRRSRAWRFRPPTSRRSCAPSKRAGSRIEPMWRNCCASRSFARAAAKRVERARPLPSPLCRLRSAVSALPSPLCRLRSAVSALPSEALPPPVLHVLDDQRPAGRAAPLDALRASGEPRLPRAVPHHVQVAPRGPGPAEPGVQRHAPGLAVVLAEERRGEPRACRIVEAQARRGGGEAGVAAMEVVHLVLEAGEHVWLHASAQLDSHLPPGAVVVAAGARRHVEREAALP